MRKLLILLIALTTLSCGTVDRPQKPSATGRTGEMLVITPKSKWDGYAGNLIRNVFADTIQWLPQPEPYFNLIQLDESGFVKLFETHRNILFVDFDPAMERAKVESSRHVWSYPQRVIRVTVPDEAALQRVLENNRQSLIDMYVETERERLINAYGRMINFSARNLVRQKFQLDITVPEGYFVAKSAQDFVWLRQTGTRDDIDLGLLIYVLPYTHPDKDFNERTIWGRRDSITKMHIPGTFENSYMTTYPEFPPVFREINFNGSYAKEARGFWRVQNDFMGGPFINITYVDEATGRLVVLDGFVYRPNKDKRDYVRQVEALMYSVKPYTGETETDEEQPV